MTVTSLEEAKKIVEEIGRDKVQAVFSYITPEKNMENYAIFTEGQLIDIYISPYCLDPIMIFHNGKWREEIQRHHRISSGK